MGQAKLKILLWKLLLHIYIEYIYIYKLVIKCIKLQLYYIYSINFLKAMRFTFNILGVSIVLKNIAGKKTYFINFEFE